MDFPLFLCPCYCSFGYSLSHQCLHFRWPTQGTAITTTLRTTMGRTTRTSIRRHPLHLLLSKCWLCKHKCFRLCSRPWSACKLLKLKGRHCHRGIGLEIFRTLSHQPFLMLWSHWMLMIGLSVDKNLQVVQCNNCEKVLLASHQLSGLAADWWDAYMETHEESKSINWPEFRVAFCAHHVPKGFSS
jgi:hypothetical protein